MRRRIFLVSLCVLTLALSTFVDDPVARYLPRSVAVVLAAAVVTGWAIVLWRLFRSTPMSKREKTVAWLSAAGMVCGLIGVFQVGHFTWLGLLTNLAWHGVWLSLCVAFVIAARLVAPKRSYPTSTSFTVESESPSHVTTANDA
jgi:MFS family permease